jgi:DNA-binding NtrC family response regulator
LRIKNGNMTQTAVFLRIPRHVLIYRLEKYGIRRGGSLADDNRGGAEYSSVD